MKEICMIENLKNYISKKEEKHYSLINTVYLSVYIAPVFFPGKKHFSPKWCHIEQNEMLNGELVSCNKLSQTECIKHDKKYNFTVLEVETVKWISLD